MLIDVTHPAVHATVTATAVLGASLLGMAPGPYLVGLISDVATLKTALTVAPLMSIVAAIMFVLASRHYESDIAKRELGPVRAVGLSIGPSRPRPPLGAGWDRVGRCNAYTPDSCDSRDCAKDHSFNRNDKWPTSCLVT